MLTCGGDAAEEAMEIGESSKALGLLGAASEISSAKAFIKFSKASSGPLFLGGVPTTSTSLSSASTAAADVGLGEGEAGEGEGEGDFPLSPLPLAVRIAVITCSTEASSLLPLDILPGLSLLLQ